jgi:hypothetical protein
MLTLSEIIAVSSIVISAVGWGVVWGRTTQRLKAVEDRTRGNEKSIEGMKAERQDIVVAIARLEVKVDELKEAIKEMRG